MKLLRTWSLVPLLAVGCAPGGDSPTDALPTIGPEATAAFRTDRPTYRLGDTARFILRNESAREVRYDLCLTARESKAGGRWERVESLRLCAADGPSLTLAPGKEAVLGETVTAQWQPGEHRMVTPVVVTESGARTEVTTPSFTVER